MTALAQRLASLDWTAIRESLEQHGHALTPSLLTPSECEDLVNIYTSAEAFPQSYHHVPLSLWPRRL
jgi:hypothetical protein